MCCPQCKGGQNSCELLFILCERMFMTCSMNIWLPATCTWHKYAFLISIQAVAHEAASQPYRHVVSPVHKLLRYMKHHISGYQCFCALYCKMWGLINSILTHTVLCGRLFMSWSMNIWLPTTCSWHHVYTGLMLLRGLIGSCLYVYQQSIVVSPLRKLLPYKDEFCGTTSVTTTVSVPLKIKV